MMLKNIHLVAPCKKCPYKLGQIQTIVNPCPGCKLNHYNMYNQFVQQLSKKPID